MKMTKRMISLIMVIVLMMCASATTAFASEVDNTQKEIELTRGPHYPYTGMAGGLSINTTYKRVAYCDTSGSGFNCNVLVGFLNNTYTNNSVQLRGKTGNVLWTGTHGFSTSSTYWCGSDVYSIWIKTNSGTGTGWAYNN